jgi:hypothetical protein
MSKTYDAMMKLLDEKGSIPDDEAARLITESGPLDDEEKKKVAAAIKMAKVLNKSDDKEEKKADSAKADKTAGGDDARVESKDKPSDAEVTMDEYLVALSVLDSDEASKEEKEKAQKAKDKFESQ